MCWSLGDVSHEECNITILFYAECNTYVYSLNNNIIAWTRAVVQLTLIVLFYEEIHVSFFFFSFFIFKYLSTLENRRDDSTLTPIGLDGISLFIVCVMWINCKNMCMCVCVYSGTSVDMAMGRRKHEIWSRHQSLGNWRCDWSPMSNWF